MQFSLKTRMDLAHLVRDKYVIAGMVIYACSILYLHFEFEMPIEDFLSAFLLLGVCFSLIGWILTMKIPLPSHRSSFKHEIWVITFLLLWITAYITFGGTLINSMLPDVLIQNEQLKMFTNFFKKAFVFVLLPYWVYRYFGFTLVDFGWTGIKKSVCSRELSQTIIILSITALIFQFFLGSGSAPIKKGETSLYQLAVGLPLTALYLLFDVGLVEEFFFRAFLQSRITVCLKSLNAGVLITAFFFGIVHAPGLYLRGAASEGISEQLPFLFWLSYTIGYMSVAGIFIGVVWARTKNLFAVMIIHSLVDLFPNAAEFIKIWNI